MMRLGLTRSRVLAAAFAAGLAALAACGSEAGIAPSATADVAVAPSPQPALDSTPAATEPSATSTPEERSAAVVLNELFFVTSDFRVGLSIPAMREAAQLKHPGLLPPLIELTRFAFSEEEVEALGEVLRTLTDEDFRGTDFFAWYGWMGRNQSAGEELEEYPDWKARLYGRVDPRFRRFFYTGVETRVPLWAAQWGGVRLDGIPPLDQPNVIPAQEALFMEADEQVFGVTINGESRAYPLRIMNWHEMTNDVLGGKPITLVY